jgi:hypothetical protein
MLLRLYTMDVRTCANVSELHAAPIFRVDVKYFQECHVDIFLSTVPVSPDRPPTPTFNPMGSVSGKLLLALVSTVLLGSGPAALMTP